MKYTERQMIQLTKRWKDKITDKGCEVLSAEFNPFILQLMQEYLQLKGATELKSEKEIRKKIEECEAKKKKIFEQFHRREINSDQWYESLTTCKAELSTLKWVLGESETGL